MKRLSQIQKTRFARLSRKRNEKRLKRKYGSQYIIKRKQKRSLSAFVKQLKTDHPKLTLSYKRGRIELKSPEIMRLGSSKEEIIQFLQCMRRMTGLKAKQVSVDFSTIKDISPLCAMLLASEVHRWQLAAQRKLWVLSSETWTPSVKQLLHDIGLFNLVSVQNPVHLPEVETEEKFIRIRSATLVDLQEAIDQIEHEVGKIAILLNSNPLLYGGIEEAVTNVLQWAYKGFEPKRNEEEIVNRWWFFASYNTKTGRMTLMVYDHGVGIPKTLPTYKWGESVRKWLDERGVKEYTDEKIIEAAMKFPRSASGHEYRAKGLRKMKELLARFERGALYVFSGRGEYQIDSKGKEITRLHKFPIGGTLTAWEVYADENGSND